MQYWLMKTEPDVFSIDDLASRSDQTEPWNGVRNYQARNNMMEMAIDDLILFYHSNAEPSGIAGIAKVAKTSYPDPTQFDKKSEYFDPKASKEKPRWFMVDVKFVKKFKKFLSLAEIKSDPKLKNMPLVQKGSRLSVMKVEKKDYEYLTS
jgi:predicted RNA-binding protein with PUA-like domain